MIEDARVKENGEKKEGIMMNMMCAWKILVRLIFGIFLILGVASQASTVGAYVVDSNDDDPDIMPGDGSCRTTFGRCTLHAAIDEANADGVSSMITFSMKFNDFGSTIRGDLLPALTENNTTIDASSQWDFEKKRPGVTLFGGITIDSNGNVVRGLEFGGGTGVAFGIKIKGNANIIGGINIVNGINVYKNIFISSELGIEINYGAYNHIIGNWIGTVFGSNSAQPGLGGDVGIWIIGERNTIEENLIVNCTGSGVEVGGFATLGTFNTLRNNIIGLNMFADYPVPNEIGVTISGDYNTIEDNKICGNNSHGIKVDHGNDNTINGNDIGARRDLHPGYNLLQNGGDGIHIRISNGNVIGEAVSGYYGFSNYIRYNAGHGVNIIGGDDNILYNNNIRSNELSGVKIDGSENNIIGGMSEYLGNFIWDNAGHGIWLTDTSGTEIKGNFIGLDDYGCANWDRGNVGYGILVEDSSHDNVIGGSGEGDGNWIAHNHMVGIMLTGADTYGNEIYGNGIGIEKESCCPDYWWECSAPNYHHGIGIYNGAHDNKIGGSTGESGNTIVANGWSGIAIVNSGSNSVTHNKIGVDREGFDRGNGLGIHVVNSPFNQINLNEIAYNGSGVKIEGWFSFSNPITFNSIYSNGGKGIELVDGGNIMLASPVISSVKFGHVAGTACAGCLVQIFSDLGDEGRVYEGLTWADATTGNFAIDANCVGWTITATATDGSFNTSEFSSSFWTNNRYVSTDGDCSYYPSSHCYESIQNAIDDPSTGSVIFVKQGTYAESLSLGSNQTLLIKGGYDPTYTQQTANTTFIEAPGPTIIKASNGALKFQMINMK